MNIGQWLLEKQQSKPFIPGVTGRIIRGCEEHGDSEEAYMIRYFLYRSKLFNVYLHHFLRSDTGRALHDHPWSFVTTILTGGYWEHEPTIAAPFPQTIRRWRKVGSVLCHHATHKHYVELPREWWTPDDHGPEIPAITLCIVGRKWREWGFHLPEGWLNWRAAFEKWGCKP